MPSCRHCADKLTPEPNGSHRSLYGFPCVAGHDHEPWPDILYTEEPVTDAHAEVIAYGMRVIAWN